jgi:hypothetical protein
VGDGPEYHYLKITVLNQDGLPIPGIRSDHIYFSVIAEEGTIVVGTLSCTFIPFGPSLQATDPLIITTNYNGEILFKISGDTTISGNIDIKVKIDEVPLEDIAVLPCKTYDLDYDGVVNCTDFEIFASDYRRESGIIWRSDFDWDGDVDIGDFAMFADHIQGPCELNSPPYIPRRPEPRNQQSKSR